MVNLMIVFWSMVVFFGVIGYLRGWQKEVIALSGLIASLAALNTFGFQIVNAFNLVLGSDNAILGSDLSATLRRQFWVQAFFHTLIAFFSYQVVARLAVQAARGKIGERLRSGLESRVIGFLFGAVNGYLFIGGLWGFLEYQISDGGYVQLPLGTQYVFEPNVIRPITEGAIRMATYLPQGITSPSIWLILFFIAFFFIIVALI